MDSTSTRATCPDAILPPPPSLPESELPIPDTVRGHYPSTAELMAGGFEKMTAQQYRDSLKPATRPKAVERPIFSQNVYEASSGELIIEIEPMGAPRTTRNSRFNPTKAKAIDRYVATCAKIREDCALMGYKLGAMLKVRFEMSMPASWSDKKKAQYAGQPHQQKSDIDNCCKLVMDAFKGDDSHVHTLIATKIWAYTGCIVIIR